MVTAKTIPEAIKESHSFIKTKEVVDWANVPSGTYFELVKGKRKVTGLIFNDIASASIYLCTNTAALDGSRAPNRLGYKYSYEVDYSENDPTNLDTQGSITFPPLPEGFVPPIILPTIAGYMPVIGKGRVKFGCQTVSNKDIRELVKHLKD